MNKLYRFFKNEFFLLSLIFVVFFLTRFYNLDKRIIFGWDQEQISNQIRDIVKNHHFTLLGPRVNNDLGFFLAPYLTYLLLPLYLLANLHPNVLIWLVILTNVIFFFASFLTIKKIFSTTHALWFLLLWTINSRTQFFDAIPWWPLLIPLGVILTIYFLYLVQKKPNNTWYWVSLGLIEGFFINMHFQFIFIVVLVNIFLFLLYAINFNSQFFTRSQSRKKHLGNLLKVEIPRRDQRSVKNWLGRHAYKFTLKNMVIYFLAFILTFTPLLIFDLRHNFLNTKLFFNFFSPERTLIHKQYFSWVPVLSNFFDAFTYWSNPILTALLYFVFFILFWILKNTKKTFYHIFYSSTLVIWVVVMIFFTYYGQRPSEYYFMFLLPFMLLTIVDFFVKFNQKKLLLIILIIFSLINGKRLIKNLEINYGGLYYKEQVVKYVKKTVGEKTFNISYDGVSVDHGFRYLLDYYKINPRGNPNDPLIEVSIPAKKNSVTFGKYGITMPFEWKK